MKIKIAILGSTGEIGKTLIKILKKDKKSFEVCLLSINKNINELVKQVRYFNVKNLVISDRFKFIEAKKIFKNKKINIYNSYDNLNLTLKNKKIDYTINAISGLDGLNPTLKIIKHTKKIAIANKESIICGWPLIKKEINKHNVEFIPIDSEHFSIWSLMNKLNTNNIERIYITASGGPFNKFPINRFKFITPKLALNHPNWKMGKKITIDSATMMNKVFEIIEAQRLFNVKYNKLSILVHPKSYVHAMIKFNNGLTKLLIHDTNMMIPIFNSIYPNFKKKLKTKEVDFSILNDLNFQKIDLKRFPVVQILESLSNKHSLFETIIVSANDKLVNMFLEKKILFTDISKILLRVSKHKPFQKYKRIRPKKIKDILELNHYVSLKISTLSI